MRELRYSPQLDGLRAICIILTLLHHIDGVPSFINGTVGVDVFFPLSGFLITAILLNSGWHDLRGYYIRRFFRIAPVYYLSFLITALLTVAAARLSIGESRMDQLHNIFVPSLLFSRELATNAPTLFGQAWTVGIEEKFYIVWPVLFLLLGSNSRRIVLLCAIVLSLALLGIDSALRGYGGIALGCVASIAFFRYNKHVSTSLALGLMLVAYVFCQTVDLWFENIAVSCAAALLIPSLYATNSKASKVLSNPLLMLAGKLTFSVYMLHVVVLFAVKFILRKFGIDHWTVVFLFGYLSTLALAWIVYRYFEEPLIQMGKRLAKGESSRAGVTAGL